MTFRFGAEAECDTDPSLKNECRIRHFYHYDGSKYSMPLYNNSYYFYFGVKKGSTAIDKFNKMFNASCFKRHTHPFTIDITKRGRSYCPSMYGNNNDGYGYIKIVMDDITVPYSYTLTDSFGNEVVSETGMSLTSFAIGGIIDEDGKYFTLDDGDSWSFDDIKCTFSSEDQKEFFINNCATDDYITVFVKVTNVSDEWFGTRFYTTIQHF